MPATNESIFTFQIGLRPPRPSSAAPSHNLDAEVSYAKEETSLPKLPLRTLICSTVLQISQRLLLQLQSTQVKRNAHPSTGEPTRPTLWTLRHSTTPLNSAASCDEFQFLSQLRRAPDGELSPGGVVCFFATKRDVRLWRLGWVRMGTRIFGCF